MIAKGKIGSAVKSEIEDFLKDKTNKFEWKQTENNYYTD